MLMQLSRPLDVMIAAEEGLRCKALAAVVAEIRGNPVAVNFTATKRLALRAEAVGVPCWLIRQAATADLSTARDRWRITMLPSAANPDDPRAPAIRTGGWSRSGRATAGRGNGWHAMNGRRPMGAADRLDLVAAVPDGAVAKSAG